MCKHILRTTQPVNLKSIVDIIDKKATIMVAYT